MLDRRTRRLLALVPALALVAAGCGGDDDDDATADDGDDTASEDGGSITLYSGRDEELVQPLIDEFTTETGIEVEVRYGDSAEMGAQLLEEGEETPADVFYSQEVGAVGVLAKADLLAPLPDEVVDRAQERFQPDDDNLWVGVTGRSRVIVYNPTLVDTVPEGVLDLTDEEYRGQVAWVPGNASFQAFITGFRASQGDEAAEEWLTAMQANDARAYEDNSGTLEAVNNGDIAIGLINHYYWARSLPELGDDMVAELRSFGLMEGDGPGR